MPSTIHRRRRVRLQQRSSTFHFARLVSRGLQWTLCFVVAVGLGKVCKEVVDEYALEHQARQPRLASAEPSPQWRQADDTPAAAPRRADTTAAVDGLFGKNQRTSSVTSSAQPSAWELAYTSLPTSEAGRTTAMPPPATTSQAPAAVLVSPALGSGMLARSEPSGSRSSVSSVGRGGVPTNPGGSSGSYVSPPAVSPVVAAPSATAVPTDAARRTSAFRGQPSAAAAPTFTWSGVAAAAQTSDPNWTTNTNWAGNVAPGTAANANVTYAASPTAATATTVNANYSVNSLTFQAGAPAYTVTNSNDATLTVGAGGITQASANTQTLSVLTVLGTAQTWNVSDPTGTLAHSGVISGAGSITKTGAGTLALSGNNTFTGGTTLTGGTLNILSNTALGSGTFTVTGGTLLSNGAQLTNPVALHGDLAVGPNRNTTVFEGDVDLGNATRTLTLNPPIGAGFVEFTGAFSATSATAGLTIVGNYNSTAIFTGSNNSNTYTGTTTVDGANLYLQKGEAQRSISGDLVVQNNGVVYTRGGQLVQTTNLVLRSGGTFNATGGLGNSADETVASLNGEVGTTVLIGNSQGRTALTVGQGRMDGIIEDGRLPNTSGLQPSTRGSRPADGPTPTGGALFMAGPGTLTLTNNNFYSGGTTVGGGTLLADNVPGYGYNVQSATGGGAVNVYGGGTLGGFGQIFGPVSLQGGEGAAILSPGDGIGRLTIQNDLTLTGNVRVHLELGGTTAGIGYDQVLVTGELTLDGVLEVKVVNGFSLKPGMVFDILDAGNPVTGKFANVVDGKYTDENGDVFLVNYADTDPNNPGDVPGSDVSLTVLAVPEPGSWVALLGGLAVLGWSVRRRRCQP